MTTHYARSTKELLDEQIRTRKISSIEKKLENIYSPINIALNKFKLNCEYLPEDRVPQVYNTEFKDLNDVIMDIASRYYHLLNQETINYYDKEVWKAWLQYSNNSSDINNYKLLNSRIKMFNDLNTRQLNLEKRLFNDLQQLGENMNFDETQMESNEIREIFLKGIKETKISFLDEFEDKREECLEHIIKDLASGAVGITAALKLFSAKQTEIQLAREAQERLEAEEKSLIEGED